MFPYRFSNLLILNIIFFLTFISTSVDVWANVTLFQEARNESISLLRLIGSSVSAFVKFLYLLTLVKNSESQIINIAGINAETERFLQHSSTTSDASLGVANKDSGILSSLTFSWVWSLMIKGRRGDINDVGDTYELPVSLQVEDVSRTLQLALDNVIGERRNEFDEAVTGNILLKALINAFGAEFFLYGIFKLISTVIQFGGPILLSHLLMFIETPHESILHGYLYAFGIFSSAVCAAFANCHFLYAMVKVKTKIGGSLATAVYRKILNVSSYNLSSLSSGEVLDLMHLDVARVLEFCDYFHECWSLPLQVLIALYLVYNQVGLAFLACILLTLILIPLTYITCSKILKYEVIFFKFKDERVKFMNEILKGIRIIKLCAWDLHFRNKVQSIRFKEMKLLKINKYLDAICVFFWQNTPTIMAVSVFMMYTLLGNQLTAAKVFTCLALFDLLIAPLNDFSWSLLCIMDSWISLKRIQKLMRLPNSDYDEYYQFSASSENTEITFHDATFLWKNPNVRQQDNASNSDDDINSVLNERKNILNDETSPRVDDFNTKCHGKQNFCLDELSFTVHEGDLIGIIGKIGSGKTSLMCALLSEMYKVEGEITVSEEKRRSGFGIFMQESWIQHGTIRDNILFGKDYDKQMYDAVISACALVEDLKIWKSGDLTQVGENGVTLSGGQKARLTLARAIYQDKDVYLLDDPFSAVDADVAKHIYVKCIRGMLKQKTVFLSTHHHRYLCDADHIIVMEDGKIINQGCPDVILKFLDTRGFSEEESDCGKNDVILDEDKQEDDLMQKETKEYGAVKANVYKTYWNAIGTGVGMLICLMLILMQTSQSSMELWLAHWVSKAEEHNDNGNISSNSTTSDDTMYYLTVYGSIGASNSIFTFARAFLAAFGGIQAAIWIHDKLLSSIMKARVGFFESTPVGRILNRFSSDLTIIDHILPYYAQMLSRNVFLLFGSLFVIVYSIYWIVLIIIPLAVIYYFIQRFYRKTSRELSRIKSIKLSPIYTLFSETLSGHIVIRAFEERNSFCKVIMRYITDYRRAFFSTSMATVWLLFYLEMIGVLLVGSISAFVIVKHHFSSVSSGFIGLAISSSFAVNSTLKDLVIYFASVEKHMVSVERANEYIEQTVSESDDGIIDLPTRWPECGVVRFCNIYLRYRENLPFVLKDINFEAKPAEKIGIVGRTGSGKSSLLSLLFRMVDHQTGDIYIDDVNIDDLKLSDLRSKITIIPQDPFLFSGTIRENIDPRGEHTDSEIWNALESCQLRHMVQNRLGGLDGNVGEQGKELSSGQKQLLCLARAIITNAKVLCIDEATASVDRETDRLIQETIRKVFKDNTVLTIAHRIDTIMHCDRMLVLSEGRIVEFDTPGNLLQNDESVFYNLYHK
ncbi:ABCC10 (predicted) [Pycnogonum litorale]